MATVIAALGRLFTPEKTVDNRTLNLLGAQAFRALAAHALTHARPIPVPAHVEGEVAELKQNGLLVMRDFLPAEAFRRVQAEAAELRPDGALCHTVRDGWTTRKTIAMRTVAESVAPAIHDFFRDPRLSQILEAVEQRPLGPMIEHGDLEVLTYDENRELDTQTELHSDCFYNTHKAWFYLHDVRTEQAPFCYVKGSNRLTLKRLEFIYRESWDHAPDASPSRRISEYEQSLLAEETVLTVPGNTLVMANTCGYHRRVRGVPGESRSALSFFLRANPFAPHALHSAVARYPRAYEWLRRVKYRKARA